MPCLVEALKRKDRGLRALAAETLASIGPEARAAEPALREALKDEAPSVRFRAAEALWILVEDADVMTGALAEALALGSEDSSDALLDLERIGSAATAAVPAVVEFMRDEEHRYRRMGEEVHESPPMSKP